MWLSNSQVRSEICTKKIKSIVGDLGVWWHYFISIPEKAYTQQKRRRLTVCVSVFTPVHRDRKKYDPGSREMAGWMLDTGSATDLNSSVPTQVEARRGVNTMWFLGETHTTSYKPVSIPFISLQAAHPVPSTTTLGLSFPFSVGTNEDKPDVVKKRVCLIGETVDRDRSRWRRNDIFWKCGGRESRKERFCARCVVGLLRWWHVAKGFAMAGKRWICRCCDRGSLFGSDRWIWNGRSRWFLKDLNDSNHILRSPKSFFFFKRLSRTF